MTEINEISVNEAVKVNSLPSILARYGYRGREDLKPLNQDVSFFTNFSGYYNPDVVSIGLKQYVAATIPYTQDTSLTVITNTSSIRFFKERSSPALRVEDIIYTNKRGKAFNYRSLLDSKCPLDIDPQLVFESYGGEIIQLTVPGKFNPPDDPIERGMWNVYKKIEPVVVFHEAKHRSQFVAGKLNRGTINQPHIERDAWAYGINVYRSLKQQGLDLIPGVTNSQILSRIELGLTTYDLAGVSDTLFSGRSRGSLGSVGAILKSIIADTSLVSDTLHYKGAPKLPPVKLSTFL